MVELQILDERKVLFPVGWELFLSSVVSGESVDSGLNHNESVFGVSVFSELFKVLSDVQSLFDQAVEIFGDRGSAACSLETKNTESKKPSNFPNCEKYHFS